MMRSLRARLLLGTILATATVLTLSGWAFYRQADAHLRGEFDAALAERARLMAFMVVENDEGVPRLVYDRPQFKEYDADGDEYFQIWRTARSGFVPLFRSPSLGSRELAQQSVELGRTLIADGVLPDGRPGRVIATRFRPRPDIPPDVAPRRDPTKEMLLVAARSREQLDDRLHALRLLLWSVGGGAVAASALVLTLVVAALSRPLARLARSIDRVDPNDLAARFGDRGLPSELRPVASRLDELIRRVDQVLQREKSFTSNVAHELRNPLAGLRMTLDVALTRPRAGEEYVQALRECQEIAGQMQALVDNLLALARLDADRMPVDHRAVQPSPLMRECWRPFDERARARGLRIEWDLDEAIELQSDREKLRLILTNLYDNAVSYADDGGRVRVALQRDGGGARLTVANTGCRLDRERAQRAFERFWRGDEARSGGGVHCGLGLALCQRLAQLLGCTIAIDAAMGGEFGVSLAFATRR